ncbi:FtsX-like permease family protein [Streptosporangium amethystogenes]|uniref:FtsX-like permease family protein n=1 Tax=Streptosporangium amethystogenes TaxID=2002 RepID=UPI0037A9D95D
MSALLAALRISRGDIRRARGRSALIMTMIGLPVLVVTCLLTLLQTWDINPREGVLADIGAADARIRVTSVAGKVEQDLRSRTWTSSDGSRALTRPWTEAGVARLLGPGVRLLPVNEGSVEHLGRNGRLAAYALEVDLRDPLTTGMYRLVGGHFPASAQEVVVTAAMLERGGRLGEPLEVTRAGKPMRVVGVVEHPHRLRDAAVVGLPGTLLLNERGTSGSGWLADTPEPVTWAVAQRLNAAGLLVESRAVAENPPGPALLHEPSYDVNQRVGIGLAGVMTVLEVVLLAGPAFAVGLRRRRGELALIAAQGGSPAHLRLIVLADGVVLGGGAAVIGLVLGVGLASLSAALGAGRLIGVAGPLEVPWVAVVIVALFGTGSGLAAAVLPALRAARQDPAAVLGGRAGAVRARAGRPVPGMLLLLAGAAATVLALRYDAVWVFTAAVLTQLGLVALAPGLVKGVAGLASRLPLPFRLAARDASRHRGRTASAVAAVMTATATVVAAGIAVNSNFAQNRDAFQAAVPAATTTIEAGALDDERWATLRATAGRVLPGVPLIEAAVVRDTAGTPVQMTIQPVAENAEDDRRRFYGYLPIGDERLLTLVQGRRDPVAAAALASGKAVVFDPRLVWDGKLSLNLIKTATPFPVGKAGTFDGGTALPENIAVPAVLATAADPRYAIAVLPPAALRDAGLRTEPRLLYVDPASYRLGAGQRAVLERELVEAIPEADLRVTVESGFQGEVAPLLWLLLGAASVLVLGGTFAATGLAAADMRPDLTTMAAVGAPPGTRRLVVAGQAGFIAVLGVVTGAVAGGMTGVAAAWPMTTKTYADFLTSAGAIPPLPRGTPTVEIPWPLLAAVVIGLPVLAALLAGAFTRARVTLTRRTG